MCSWLTIDVQLAYWSIKHQDVAIILCGCRHQRTGSNEIVSLARYQLATEPMTSFSCVRSQRAYLCCAMIFLGVCWCREYVRACLWVCTRVCARACLFQYVYPFCAHLSVCPSVRTSVCISVRPPVRLSAGSV